MVRFDKDSFDKAKRLYESIWVDNGTHSEEYVIGKIAQGLEIERNNAWKMGALSMRSEIVKFLDESAGINSAAFSDAIAQLDVPSFRTI